MIPSLQCINSCSKEWANNLLRYSISCMKQEEFLSTPRNIYRFVTDNIAVLEKSGFWWQGKQLRKWLSRYCLIHMNCMESDCFVCKMRRSKNCPAVSEVDKLTGIDKDDVDITYRARKSPFIRKFTKTPKGVVCPHFYILGWANGCPYKCDYCYLQGTYKGNVNPHIYTNLGAMEKEVKKHLKKHETPTLLNTGELSDGLWNEAEVGLLDRLLPLFTSKEHNPYGHKLMCLTKSIDIDTLLQWSLEHPEETDNVIVAWSVNPWQVSEVHEHGSPASFVRIEHAKYIAMAGYQVRLRIDPMVPFDGWEDVYPRFVKQIMRIVVPERITIGSLRVFPILPRMAKKLGRDTEVFKYVKDHEDPDGRLRVDFETRMSMYVRILDSTVDKCKTGLCKETVDMHMALKKEGYSKNQRCACNCLPE